MEWKSEGGSKYGIIKLRFVSLSVDFPDSINLVSQIAVVRYITHV